MHGINLLQKLCILRTLEVPENFSSLLKKAWEEKFTVRQQKVCTICQPPRGSNLLHTEQQINNNK